MLKISCKVCAVGVALSMPALVQAQNTDEDVAGFVYGTVPRTVTTSVPFLAIGPDARAGGMGDQGVATAPDANAMHWNVAKLGFVEDNMSLSVSYTPWLRNLVPDINLAYVSFYRKMNDRFTLGASLKYFSLGDITFTDNEGNFQGNYTPNEFSVDAGGSLLLSKKWALGAALRFLYSNLTLGQQVGGVATGPGIAGCGDFGFYFQDEEQKILKRDVIWRFGVTMQNIGSKIRYNEAQTAADWLPVNLRVGGSNTIQIDDYNSFMLSLEMSKLMVPTPPVRDPQTGDILEGQDPDRPVLTGMISSFWDAPGGFSEEWDEFVWSVAAEYWYNKTLAVRSGFFYENPLKGNRRYITLGAGVRYNVFGLDFSYLFALGQTNPLANTLRFTLTFDFGKAVQVAE